MSTGTFRVPLNRNEFEAFGHECTLCDHPTHMHLLIEDETTFGPYRCHYDSCDCMMFATTRSRPLTEEACDSRWPDLADHLRAPDGDVL